ncbi:hypothetical protein BJY52DRAFT_1115946, partial [Lactarius psammicola]
AESLVLFEFLADLHPKIHLLPSALPRLHRPRSPTTSSRHSSRPSRRRAGPSSKYSAGPARCSSHQEEGFVLGGQWSIADDAAVPFLRYIELMLQHDIVNFAEEAERRAYGEVFEEKAFARLR